MTEDEIRLLRYRIAELSIGPSTLRGQGAKGVAQAARDFLKRLRLHKYAVSSRRDFLSILNKDTRRLQQSLPPNAKHWGAARKALNIFLRNVVYNRHLCTAYGLSETERLLEIPLDSHVGNVLCRSPEGNRLPRWTTIKSLTKDKSDEYQTVAREIAHRLNTVPIHLDLYCFRRPDTKL